MKPLLTLAAIAALLAGQPVWASAQDPEPNLAEVSVVRQGDVFAVEYRLNEDRPAFAFHRSALLREGRRPWRAGRWTLETPGVEIVRIGRYDVLRSVDGGPLPRRVNIAMRPAGGDLEAAYSPSLVFSDGSVALYTEQFDLIPLHNAEAAADLPADFNGLEMPGGPTEVTWRDAAGPVLFRGQRRDVATTADGRAYVYFGPGEATEGEAVAAIVDPALPAWLARALDEFTPSIMAEYARRLGPRVGDRPTLMVSWSGPTSGVTSMAGSVLPNLVVMDLEGEGVLERSPAVFNAVRWFIAHEAAHFWLGGEDLRYEFARDGWITEGGSDLMAIRALATLDPAYDARSTLQPLLEECLDLADNGPVAEAGDRGDHRAFYGCGAVWALAFEAAARRSGEVDWLEIVARFRRAQTDNVLSREDWLLALTEAAGGDPAPRRIIESMLDEGSADPAGDLGRLFDHTGVAYRREAGRLVLS
jgi:hypothetical protein